MTVAPTTSARQRSAAGAVPVVHGGARLSHTRKHSRERTMPPARLSIRFGLERSTPGSGRPTCRRKRAARGRLSWFTPGSTKKSGECRGLNWFSTARPPTPGTGKSCTSLALPSRRRPGSLPLSEGDIRSFFSMTEPEGPGQTQPAFAPPPPGRGRVGSQRAQVVFLGAEGAAFGIVMAVTEPEAPARRAHEPDHRAGRRPRVEIEPVPVLGHRGRGWSTHCEVRYRDVRVPRAIPPRPAGRRVQHRPNAIGTGPYPPCHALAGPDAASI